MQLLKTPAVEQHSHQQKAKKPTCVAPPTVRKVHNILRSAFHQAVKWELMEKNPAMYATVPKAEKKKREVWDAPTLFRATELCEDERLKLSINLSFACLLWLVKRHYKSIADNVNDVLPCHIQNFIHHNTLFH